MPDQLNHTATKPMTSIHDLPELLKLHGLWLQGSEEGTRANLRNANLSNANLSNANLCYADLRYANLCGANLCYANLRDTNLCGATGNMREIKSAHVEQFPVVWCCTPTMETLVQIGCRKHPLEWWETADQARIERIAGGSWGTWQRLGPIIISLIKASPATPYGEQK
jgi:hypothetical protein